MTTINTTKKVTYKWGDDGDPPWTICVYREDEDGNQMKIIAWIDPEEFEIAKCLVGCLNDAKVKLI